MTLVVAIDGPAAAGKGTLARRLAAALSLQYLDTGLLYRAVGRRVLSLNGDPTDTEAAAHAARTLTPEDLARADLRGPEADAASSAVARVPAVRAALLAYQRQVAAEGAVLDGRDIGTVVVPDAAVKLFVTADLDARARRRWQELHRATPLADVVAAMAARDRQDEERAAAPLRPAPDAIVLDTTALDAEAVFTRAMELVQKRAGGAMTVWEPRRC